MRKLFPAVVVVMTIIAALALVQVGYAGTESKPSVSKKNIKSVQYKLQYKKLYYDSGTLYYEGQARPGQWGTIRHTGNWIPCGRGKLYYFEGPLYYDGDVVDGWRSGKGKSYSMNGELDYSGFWKNDSPYVKEYKNGTHVLYFADGKTKFYEGEWKNGVREGQGVTYYRNGMIEYEGAYHDGRMDGSGKYYNRDGTICYVGLFRKGVPCGNGKLYEHEKWNPLNQKYKVDYKALAKEIFAKIQG